MSRIFVLVAMLSLVNPCRFAMAELRGLAELEALDAFESPYAGRGTNGCCGGCCLSGNSSSDPCPPVTCCPTECGVTECRLPPCCATDCCATDCCTCAGKIGFRFANLLRGSDQAFDDFISPMTNFVFFEDPRTLTELRPIFVQHQMPNVLAPSALPGGEVRLMALQARLAVTERLSLIAVKDGFIDVNVGGPLTGLVQDGWSAVTAGAKYNLIRDPQRGRLLSGGLTYEIPIGSQRTLQDVGDGEFHLFLSGGQRLLQGDAHLLATVGWRQPLDKTAQTTSLHLSTHSDLRLTQNLYFVSEMVWWHWSESAGGGAPLGVAGQDLFNLPTSNVTGNDLLISALGFRLKPSRRMELGAAYETPLSNRKDILENRVTVDMILRY